MIPDEDDYLTISNNTTQKSKTESSEELSNKIYTKDKQNMGNDQLLPHRYHVHNNNASEDSKKTTTVSDGHGEGKDDKNKHKLLKKRTKNKGKKTRNTTSSMSPSQGISHRADEAMKLEFVGRKPKSLRSTKMPSKDNNKIRPAKQPEVLSPYSIQRQMKRFAKKSCLEESANVTMTVIGRTVEFNDIILLKMTDFGNDSDSYFRADSKFEDIKVEKKIVFIVHGLTVAGMKYLMRDDKMFDSLMRYYMKHLDKFDIYVVPMANPDGYAATMNGQASSYWNKNMAPQIGCPGVVLDRNFDVAWNSSEKISSCSPVFPGPKAFSEAETKAIRNVFHQYGHQIIAYIHVHASSYDANVFKGDAVLYPSGFTEEQGDDDKYIDLKGDVDEAIKNATFRVVYVAVDTLYNWYGKVTGSSVDYAATVYGIPFALEFSMQLYRHLQRVALTHIWNRIIDVVFERIWKYSNTKEVD